MKTSFERRNVRGEMLLLGRAAVHENFQVTVVKPPLQYWLTSYALPHFSNPHTAVRLWPFLYGLLATVAAGCLAYRIDPARPWLVPLSIFILLGCPLFLAETKGARLDLGLACFATLAILSAQLAREKSAWWIGVAVCAGLGALQKTPLVFLIWLILVLARMLLPNERSKLRNSWLGLSLLLGVGLLMFWPVWQMSQFGFSLRESLRLDEVQELTGPGRLGDKPYFLVPLSVIATWPAGIFALAAALILPRLLKNSTRAPVIELSAVSLGTTMFLLIGNLRSVRYALPILPALSVLCALLFAWALEQKRRVYYLLGAAILLASCAGFEVSRRRIDSRQKDFADEKFMAETLGRLQNAQRHLILLEPQIGTYIPAVGVQPVPFYLFYGQLRAPISNFTLATFADAQPQRPAIGVCDVRHFNFVRAKYSDAVVEAARGQFVCWRTPD